MRLRTPCCTFRAANKSWHVLLQAGDVDIKRSSAGTHTLVCTVSTCESAILPTRRPSATHVPVCPLVRCPPARPLPACPPTHLLPVRCPPPTHSSSTYCPFIVRLPPIHHLLVHCPPAHSSASYPLACSLSAARPSARLVHVVVSDDVVVTFNTFKTTFFVLSRLSPDCPTYIRSNRMQMYS